MVNFRYIRIIDVTVSFSSAVRMRMRTFFSEKHLAVLSDASHWHLIASGLPEEISPVRTSKHARWAKRHAEVHPHREILMVLSGRGYQKLGDKMYPIVPGTVMLFDAMETHQYGYPSGHPRAEHLWFHLMADLVEFIFVRISGKGRKKAFTHVWNRAFHAVQLGLTSTRLLFPDAYPESPSEVVRWRCLTALELLVSGLVEIGCHLGPRKPDNGLQRAVIAAVVQHIRDVHGRNCSLSRLADAAGYSVSHFAHLFKEHTGMPLLQFINTTRGSRFQQMLAEGKTLKAISTELGFAHPSALSRWRRQQRV